MFTQKERIQRKITFPFQLQIPIRDVVKVSKEKTAKFIPNAVGLATCEDKHVFSSLLSRDSTFKFMTHVWKRAMRGQPILVSNPAAASVVLPESEILTEEGAHQKMPLPLPHHHHHHHHHHGDGGGQVVVGNKINSSEFEEEEYEDDDYEYEEDLEEEEDEEVVVESLVRQRRNKQKLEVATPSQRRLFTPTHNSNNNNSNYFNGNKSANSIGGMFVSFLIVSLLVFLLCSSLYLVHRVNELQNKVESRQRNHHLHHNHHHQHQDIPNLESILDSKSSDKMRQILDSNVDQIAAVRKVIILICHIF